MTATLSKSMIR